MLKTYSEFNYGHTITEDNFYFPIIFNGETFNVELRVGTYTLGNFVGELSRALTTIPGIEFDLSLDRETRIITIEADQTFTIPTQSSNLVNNSCYSLVGLDGTSDLSGSSSYSGSQGSGFVFVPQFRLQDYIDFEDDQEFLKSSLTETGSGLTQVTSFGIAKTMSCNIKYQTNIVPQGGGLLEDPEGEDNLRKFMSYVITKAPIEFVRDNENRNDFVNCFLNSTAKSKDGTGFTLRELYAEGIAEYFETRTITFREII